MRAPNVASASTAAALQTRAAMWMGVAPAWSTPFSSGKGAVEALCSRWISSTTSSAVSPAVTWRALAPVRVLMQSALA